MKRSILFIATMVIFIILALNPFNIYGVDINRGISIDAKIQRIVIDYNRGYKRNVGSDGISEIRYVEDESGSWFYLFNGRTLDTKINKRYVVAVGYRR